MKTFYIAKILNQDLMSRPLADDFYNYELCQKFRRGEGHNRFFWRVSKILYNIGIENI